LSHAERIPTSRTPRSAGEPPSSGLAGGFFLIRAALCELASGDADPEKVAIPPNMERVLAEIRERVAHTGARPTVTT
jgi:hypothetical protein